MTPETLTRALRERAHEQGFDACAVAEARRLDRAGAALETWLARGRQAGMHWMEREPAQRADPGRLLPGCRRVVVLAANYWPSEPRQRASGAPARVARYARGRDYHKVLSRRAGALARWLDETAGSTSRACVDTAPVLERAWAERAGLGWIGKNANLLTRELGSWLLLGEVLTTAVLEPDPGPHVNHCGTCTACLDACPTQAIVADGIVDANRCIAYWTIEHRGSTPVERRAGSGEWIFGCDVCQDVCPWNRSFAQADDSDPFERRADLRGLDPEEILGLDEAEFRRRYSGTALMRAKWVGMRRNACVVLGNRGQPSALPVLGRAMTDDDPVLRSHAAWAVARIGGQAALGLLSAARDRERSVEVAQEIATGIARLRGSADPPQGDD
jgi:epoxyqueuosine reductase